VPVPIIGIGAGPYCDGQVQVWHDILGLFPDLQPKHARRYAEIGALMRQAVEQYVEEVRHRAFPTAAHATHLPAELAAVYMPTPPTADETPSSSLTARAA
jgi:3-methyl-2-oxobutanoate hydroxymethyltransferase